MLYSSEVNSEIYKTQVRTPKYDCISQTNMSHKLFFCWGYAEAQLIPGICMLVFSDDQQNSVVFL